MIPVTSTAANLVLLGENVNATLHDTTLPCQPTISEDCRYNSCVKAVTMFTLAGVDWEEHYQDLSGWCITPSPLVAQQQSAVTTDELATSLIAVPESEKFHFTMEFASAVQKCANNAETGVDVTSPQDDLLAVESDVFSMLECEHSALTSTDGPSVDYYRTEGNVFITDEQQDDNVENEFSAPLALVEGKLMVDCNAHRMTVELQTPDIVEMMSEFPKFSGTPLEPTTPLDDFLQPLADIDEGFDLVAYVFDDNSSNKPVTNRPTATAENPGQLKTSSNLIQPLGKPTIAFIRHLQAPSPSTSNGHTKEIKEEPEQDDNDTLQDIKKSVNRKRGLDHHEVSDSSDKYRELRDRNNEASKKSRLSRKTRDSEMSEECVRIEKLNEILRRKSEKMERLVKQLRNALLEAVKKK